MYDMLHNKKTIVQTRYTVKENCPALLMWMEPLEILHYFDIQKLVHVKVNQESEFDCTLSKFQYKTGNKTRVPKMDNKLKNLENEIQDLKKRLGEHSSVSDDCHEVLATRTKTFKKKVDKGSDTIEKKCSDHVDNDKNTWARIVEDNEKLLEKMN